MHLTVSVLFATLTVAAVANQRHQAWEEFTGEYQHDPQDADDPVPEITQEYGKHYGMHERDLGYGYASRPDYTAFDDEMAEHYGTHGHPVHGEHHYARSDSEDHRHHSHKAHHDDGKKHHGIKTGEHSHPSAETGDDDDWEEPWVYMHGATHVSRAVKGAWDHVTGEAEEHAKHKASDAHKPAHYEFDDEVGGRLRSRDAEPARKSKFDHKPAADDDDFDADKNGMIGEHHEGDHGVAPDDEAPDFDPGNDDHPDFFNYHKHLWARELDMDYDHEYDAEDVNKDDFHGKAFEDRLHNKDHDAEGKRFGRRNEPIDFESHADFHDDMASGYGKDSSFKPSGMRPSGTRNGYSYSGHTVSQTPEPSSSGWMDGFKFPW